MAKEARNDLRLTPVSHVRTYELIVDQLRSQIEQGHLRPGDRLPGERQLSEDLGASRSAVREALRVLEALEVTTTDPDGPPGAGMIVNPAPRNALSNLLSFEVALDHFTMLETIEVRSLLERSAVRRAAQSMTDDDRAGLQKLIDDMQAPGLARETFHSLDTEFHVRLAESGGNRLVAHLMHALRDSIQRQMMDVFAAEDWSRLARQLSDEHQTLLDAVAAGNADEAMHAIDVHITEFYEARLGPDSQES